MYKGKWIKYLFLASVIMAVNFSFGQMKKSEVKSLNYKGDNLIWAGRFVEAKDVFEQLNKEFPKDVKYQFRLAICNTHINENKAEALQSLEKLESEKKNLDDFDYHIALAYYHNYNFHKAKEHYELYYEHIKNNNEPSLLSYLQLLMDYNTNALIITKDTIGKIRLTNLGEPINSIAQEYSPYVTPSEDIMVFSYMGEKSTGGKMSPTLKPDEKFGKYYEDIFMSFRDTNNLWTSPQRIEGINTKSNEASAGISISGDHLFIYQSLNETNADIFESFLDENEKWSNCTRVKGEVNSPYWEGSVALTVDGEKLYFSSDRVGGYGGSDLYVAELQSDGSWTNVKNLGPEINSVYDEDAPYIHPDNKTLYFSSNGTNSIGGYDVFYAELRDDGKFHDITNAGVPINTLLDDRFYILSADGQTGYFAKPSSSNLRDLDIFIITPGRIGAPPLLALINGKVFLNNIKEQAVIIVRDIETGKIQGKYKTNPNSDIFSMLLNPGKNYTIDITVDGVSQYVDTLNSDFVDQFIELSHDYYVYSEDFKGDKLVLEFSLQDKVQMVYNEVTGYSDVDTNTVLQHTFITTRKDTLRLHDLNKIVKDNRIEFYQNNTDIAKQDNVSNEILSLAAKNELSDNVEYKKELGYKPEVHNSPEDILQDKSKASTITKKEASQINAIFHPTFREDELVYRVQIAAYRKPRNYVWSGRKIYGDVLEVSYPDGITRFTIGGTKHMIEAEELRQKLIRFGVEDAFLVAFKGEQRFPLYELIKN